MNTDQPETLQQTLLTYDALGASGDNGPEGAASAQGPLCLLDKERGFASSRGAGGEVSVACLWEFSAPDSWSPTRRPPSVGDAAKAPLTGTPVLFPRTRDSGDADSLRFSQTPSAHATHHASTCPTRGPRVS